MIINFNTSRWMEALPDNLKLTQINFPGTHDSSACYSSFSFISKTQGLTISEQLNAGVRYFDFRFELTDDVFYAKHGIASCKSGRGFLSFGMTADDVVGYCREFLRENPSEAILFQLKDTTGARGNEFFSEFCSRYIESNSSLWFVKNTIPTLADVRGKIVLLRVAGADKDKFSDKNSGINFSEYPYVGSRITDDWRIGKVRSLESGAAFAEMFVQDSYKVEGNRKWGTIKRFLTSPLSSEVFNICTTSCIGFKNPRFNALKINGKLMSFDFEKGKTYGIISMDFAFCELCRKIIMSNDFHCE